MSSFPRVVVRAARMHFLPIALTHASCYCTLWQIATSVLGTTTLILEMEMVDLLL